MLYIGFTNHYYTLWSVTEGERYDASRGVTYIVTTYQYHQNLSLDLETAKQKLLARDENFEIDLSLRGEHGRYYTKTRIKSLENWQYSFGKLTGSDIRQSDDVWQLKRAMREEASPRTKVYARSRLIELGELVRFAWSEVKKVYIDYLLLNSADGVAYDEDDNAYHDKDGNALPTYQDKTFHYAYATPKQKEWIEKKRRDAAASGHWFTNGSKVEVKIKETGGFSFDTQFGTTYVCIYETEDGKLVKYMGANPPDISKDNFVQVKATVKHDNYKGQDETKLQRIKLL